MGSNSKKPVENSNEDVKSKMEVWYWYGGGGGGGTPYDDQYREAPPKRGTFFFRLQAYERGGISLVEVYKRVGKSEFYGLKK